MAQTRQPVRGGVEVARGRQPEKGYPRRVGQWDLISLEAQGSWAEIHRARPAGIPADRPAAYAVKMLRPERQDDPTAVGLMAREARCGRCVSHPHLVAILEAQLRQAPPYLVMPWLEGTTLEARLAAGPWPDLPESLWLVRQAAEAVEALDAAGWTHGDIKPGNLFLSPDGHVTLMDLGFARRRGEEIPQGDHCLMGTPHYLSPECFSESPQPDVRSDIYSLGVVLYRLLAGNLPFDGRELDELAVQHKQASPPDLRRRVPLVPVAASRLTHAMLAKEPLRRPQTPGELVAQLVALEIATFSERAVA